MGSVQNYILFMQESVFYVRSYLCSVVFALVISVWDVIVMYHIEYRFGRKNIGSQTIKMLV